MQAKRDKGPKRYFVIFVVMLMAGVYILGKALYTMLPPEMASYHPASVLPFGCVTVLFAPA